MVKNVIEDGGWAWIILLMNCIGHVIIGCLVTSTGLFQAEFLKMFSESTSLSSLPASCLLGIRFAVGPIVGMLCTVFDNRKVYIVGAIILSLSLLAACMLTELSHILLTYGICAGIGFGMVQTPHYIVIGHYFVKKIALANGIAVSSTGIGFAAGSYFMIFLIQNYGWRLALSVSACMTLQFCVIGATYFPSKTEITRGQKKFRCESLDKSLRLLKQPNLWIMCLAFGFQMAGWTIHVVQFPGYVEAQGIQRTSLSQMFLAMGIVVVVSRLLCGVLCSDPRVSTLVVFAGIEGCLGSVTVLMPFYAVSFAGCMTYQVLMSFFYGASLVPLTPLIVELFGVRDVAKAFGWIMVFGGLATVVGPSFAGWLYDVSGSFESGFHVAGVLEIISSLLLLLITVCKQGPVKEEDRDEENHEKERMLIIDISGPEGDKMRTQNMCTRANTV